MKKIVISVLLAGAAIALVAYFFSGDSAKDVSLHEQQLEQNSSTDDNFDAQETDGSMVDDADLIDTMDGISSDATTNDVESVQESDIAESEAAAPVDANPVQ
jgi:hypothetical protein